MADPGAPGDVGALAHALQTSFSVSEDQGSTDRPPPPPRLGLKATTEVRGSLQALGGTRTVCFSAYSSLLLSCAPGSRPAETPC